MWYGICHIGQLVTNKEIQLITTLQPAAPPNPFYGTKTFKKSQMTMLKEEFNPFKFAKVADATTIRKWSLCGLESRLTFG